MPPPGHRSALFALLPAALTALVLSLSPEQVTAAAEPAADPAVHYLRLTRQRPSCALPPGLPITPRDPGTHLGTSGTSCSATGTKTLELWLPEARYLWIDRSASDPAAWIDLGPVGANPPRPTKPPLGLRLSTAGRSVRLETREGDTATLTTLEPGRWHEITSPDGERFWVWLASAGAERERKMGSVRRAD